LKGLLPELQEPGEAVEGLQIPPTPALPDFPEQSEAAESVASDSPEILYQSLVSESSELEPPPKRRRLAKRNLFGDGKKGKKGEEKEEVVEDNETVEADEDISGASDDSVKDADYIPKYYDYEEDAREDHESEDELSDDPLITN